MFKKLMLGAAALAVLAPQAWAARCQDGDKFLFCQWPTGCFSMDPEYDEGPSCYPPNGKNEKGTKVAPNTGSCVCENIKAACAKDGAVFSGAPVPAAIEKEPYGAGADCAKLGLTKIGGK